MSIKRKMRSVSYPKISLLAGAAIMAFAQGVSAFATGDAARNAPLATCVFCSQLQTSYEVRRNFLVRLERATGSNVADLKTGGWGGAGGTLSRGDVAWQPGTAAIGSALPGYHGGTARYTVVDEFSSECISCHDGVAASAIAVRFRSSPDGCRSRVDSFNTGHPIGMDYNAYLEAHAGYKALPGDNDIMLVRGKVGCLSCHNPLNRERGHLVKTDRSTSVCHSCHDK